MNTSTTPKVQYAYADGSDNHIRPTSITHPSGRTIDYNYGSAGGIDDAASRVQSIKDGTLRLGEYSYRCVESPGANLTVGKAWSEDFQRSRRAIWRSGVLTLIVERSA